MTIFITQGRYTGDAVRGMMNKADNREEVVKKLVEKAGGKLHGYYVTFGEYDFLSIVEAPSEEAVLTMLITTAAGGSVTDLKTTTAVTMAQAMNAFKSAKEVGKSFRSAGAR
jgi:uncharacterized protein with GYD domain